MKRAGFTMIELIFVIVILGILAAVAIPKLAATRTDAEVSKLATNIAAAQSEVATYIVANGTVNFTGPTEFKAASNVITSLLADGTDFATVSGDTVTFNDGKGTAATNKCITIKVDDSNTSNVLLTTAHLSGGTSAICKGIQSIVKAGSSTVAGNRIVY